jgi:2',3'-cyclic-nucleotide 2'-phosphodiesterase (5'-nucleotidase family)
MMKHRFPRGLRGLLILVWIFACPALRAQGPAKTADAPAKPVTVTVFCTGDIHEHTLGLARIAGYVKAAKQKDPNVLFLDAGDAIGGYGESELAVTRGEAMVRLMVAAGYDGCIFGNHCHGTGKNRLAELYLKYPKFPILAANIKWTDAEKDLARRIPPYKVFPLQGLKVAVIGTPSDDNRYARGPRFAVTSQVAAVIRMVPQVRKQADIVVALTHEYEDADFAIAKSADPPDLIVGGHSHGATAQEFGKSFLLKAGKYTRMLSMAKITWDGRKIIARKGEVMRVKDEWPEDAEVKALRDEYFKAAAKAKPPAKVK